MAENIDLARAAVPLVEVDTGGQLRTAESPGNSFQDLASTGSDSRDVRADVHVVLLQPQSGAAVR
jgi:hypothetical protein